MARNRYDGRPTDRELEILNVVWTETPCSVRDVWAALSKSRCIGYTSVLKIMQIMRAKGIIQRDATQRPQKYWATDSRHETVCRLVEDIVQRAFNGSMKSLLVHALKGRRIPLAELSAMRDLLENLDNGNALSWSAAAPDRRTAHA